MEVITLGSRSTDEIGRVSPIVIPVDSLPIPGISILTNPLIIREFGNITETNSLWIRDADNAYIRPGTNSDRVNIGSTSFLGTERLRVSGIIQATGYNLTPLISIYTQSGEMVFSDTISTATLTELLSVASTLPAANVTVEDVQGYYAGNTAEEVFEEIYSLLNTSTHSHDNKDLLDSYTNTNEDISLAIDGIHDPVTLLEGVENGLVLNQQVLSLVTADASTTGSITSDDWTYFNTKVDPTDTLTAIKDLTLTQGGLIVGLEMETAKILDIGAPGQVLTVNEDGLDISWEDPTGGTAADLLFVVPAGFTAISNPIGDVTNTNYSPVTELNDVTLLKVLQDMLFPAPSNPTFVIPTTTLTVTPSSLGTTGMFNGNYVERGATAVIGVSASFNSGNGPGGHPYAITNGSTTFLKDGVSYTTGTSVTFTANTTFTTNTPYKPNGVGETDPEFVVKSNGITVYANQYTGATTGTVTSSRTFTMVDPIYYGAFDSIFTEYDTPPTDAEIVLECTKLVSVEPTSVQISIPTYTGNVDRAKYICIAYPTTYGDLSSIKYVQGSNAEVIGSFTQTTITHTRADSSTATYSLYFALNSYTGVSGPLTYNVYF